MYYQNLIKDPDSFETEHFSFVFIITPREISGYFLATIKFRAVTNLDFRKPETIFRIINSEIEPITLFGITSRNNLETETKASFRFTKYDWL